MLDCDYKGSLRCVVYPAQGEPVHLMRGTCLVQLVPLRLFEGLVGGHLQRNVDRNDRGFGLVDKIRRMEENTRRQTLAQARAVTFVDANASPTTSGGGTSHLMTGRLPSGEVSFVVGGAVTIDKEKTESERELRRDDSR